MTEIDNNQLRTQALAELIGTFLLVFVTAMAFTGAGRVGGISDTAGALVFGLAVAVIVAGIAHISGGHINPAVTFALWFTKKIDNIRAGFYVTCQVIGGLLGAMVARLLVPGDGPLGITATLATDVTAAQGFLVEAMMAFFLVWTVFAVAVDGRNATLAAPLFIGLAVAVNILVGGAITGASMNPARYLGPAVVAGEFSHSWVYVVGPLVGGAGAAIAYTKAFMTPAKDVASAEAAAPAES